MSITEIQKKVVTAGDSGVGKSSIVLRYMENIFSVDLTATVGLDFRLKLLQKGEQNIKLQVWDTAGTIISYTHYDF